MVISLRGFMTQLLPLYPELMVITTGLAVLMLDLLVGRKYKALLGWFGFAGVAVAAFMTVKLMGIT